MVAQLGRLRGWLRERSLRRRNLEGGRERRVDSMSVAAERDNNALDALNTSGPNAPTSYFPTQDEGRPRR